MHEKGSKKNKCSLKDYFLLEGSKLIPGVDFMKTEHIVKQNELY